MGISPGTVHRQVDQILLNVSSKARRRDNIEAAPNHFGLFYHARTRNLILGIVAERTFHG